MNIQLFPCSIGGRLCAPPSKSMAHRSVLAAALAEGTSPVQNLAQSRDMADGTFSRSYIQPAGTVTATAVREGGKVVKTYIGGPVTLGEPFETEVKG